MISGNAPLRTVPSDCTRSLPWNVCTSPSLLAFRVTHGTMDDFGRDLDVLDILEQGRDANIVDFSFAQSHLTSDLFAQRRDAFRAIVQGRVGIFRYRAKTSTTPT